jgi:RNA polymerase sigma-70 factor (ECF subfamily)
MASADRASPSFTSTPRVLDSVSDVELVTRIRAGELAAFDVLYLRYHARLIDFAYRYLRSREAAEDVVQETMLAVWRQRTTWIVTHGVAAYLYAAIRNRALQIGRHADVVRRADINADTADLPGTVPLPPSDALVEARDTRRAIHAAFAKLSDDQQRVLLLRYRDGMTSEQIATVLGISTVAAKKQVQRAVGVLSALLKPLL